LELQWRLKLKLFGAKRLFSTLAEKAFQDIGLKAISTLIFWGIALQNTSKTTPSHRRQKKTPRANPLQGCDFWAQKAEK
jgi:hypothetical protein